MASPAGSDNCEEEEEDEGEEEENSIPNLQPEEGTSTRDLNWWYWYNRQQQLYCAELLIRPAWAGDFSVLNCENMSRRIFQGLNDCLSNKACSAARLVVERLPAPSIPWEEVPKSCVWPQGFQESGPTDEDIAVYFFQSLTKHETAYESLVFYLIRDDLALRASVMGSELLLFTSIELLHPFRRFQSQLYLWGVFTGDQPLM